MNKKAFMQGYMVNKQANLLGSVVKATKPVARATQQASNPASASNLLAALGGGAAAGYGISRLGAPSQTDLDNEIRKMEMAEAEELEGLIEKLKSGGAAQEQGAPSADKSIHF